MLMRASLLVTVVLALVPSSASAHEGCAEDAEAVRRAVLSSGLRR
jgi:hypothetical protein